MNNNISTQANEFEELYIKCTDALGNLLLKEICSHEQNRFKYLITDIKNKIDAQISSASTSPQLINYSYKPETHFNNELIPASTFTYQGKLWTGATYSAKSTRMLCEIKTVNWFIQSGIPKEGYLNGKSLIEIYKRINLIELAKAKQARPIFIFIFLDGTVGWYDAITCQTDMGNYLRQKQHAVFSKDKISTLAYKFHFDGAFLKFKLPFTLLEYHDKIKLFMKEQTQDERYLNLDLFNREYKNN